MNGLCVAVGSPGLSVGDGPGVGVPGGMVCFWPTTIKAAASRFWGDIVVFANIFGAKSFKVSLESISSGDNISIDYGVT